MSHLKQFTVSEQKQAKAFMDEGLTDRELKALSHHLSNLLPPRGHKPQDDNARRDLFKKVVTYMKLDSDQRWKYITFGPAGWETFKYKCLDTWFDAQLPASAPDEPTPKAPSKIQEVNASESSSEEEDEQQILESSPEKGEFESPSPKEEKPQPPDTMEKIQRIERDLVIAKNLQAQFNASVPTKARPPSPMNQSGN